MLGSMETGISGLQQFQMDLQVIGNNIANVDTVGYKSATMSFQDQFSQSLTSSLNTMQVGNGVSASAITSDFTQGTINPTGNDTDFAINGQGFFVVKDPSTGSTYVTRDGEFSLDSNGYMLTNSGMRVQGYTGQAPYSAGSTIGDIQINAATAIAALNDTTTPPPTLNSWTVNSMGEITANLSDGTNGAIGQMVMQNFSNPQALLKQGSNLYAYDSTSGPLAAPAASGTNGLGTIQQNALEQSNVDLGSAMADMITAQRAFEANGKIITTSDEILQDLVNLKR